MVQGEEGATIPQIPMHPRVERPKPIPIETINLQDVALVKQPQIFTNTDSGLNYLQQTEDQQRFIFLPHYMDGAVRFNSRDEFLEFLKHRTSSQDGTERPVANHSLAVSEISIRGERYFAVLQSEGPQEPISTDESTQTVFRTDTLDDAVNIVRYGFYQIPGRACFRMDQNDTHNEGNGIVTLAFSIPKSRLDIYSTPTISGSPSLNFTSENMGARLPSELQAQLGNLELHEDGIISREDLSKQTLQWANACGMLAHIDSNSLDRNTTIQINQERLEASTSLTTIDRTAAQEFINMLSE